MHTPARAAIPAAISLSLLAALCGCASDRATCPPGSAASAAAAAPAWQEIVTDEDHVRLRDWRSAMVAALAKARASGHDAAIAKEGALLNPDAALENAALPPGDYRCRTIRIGAKPPSTDDFVVNPPHDCQVSKAGKLERLRWIGGAQRPIGKLYPDTPSRQVFLGVMVLGDERAAIRYGRDPDRDMVGALQRIGAKSWRLLLPQPAWDSMMNVVEIAPAG
ncbi:MAG TPA: DUF4893 domain-containing protein [Sphingomonas sp.]|nr:DUF4893 domain-containing protein [Sphingomonas sp.]